MSERIYQHVTSKGGEVYTFDLGVHDDFDKGEYLSSMTNTPMYPLIPVTEDRLMALDHILTMEFTRQEVH